MRKTEKHDRETIDDLKNQIKQLSEAANTQNDVQLNLLSDFEIGDEDIEMDLDLFSPDQIANPKESYNLYYGIRSMLIDKLPKGISNKKLRQFVTSEINLFLNNGNHIKKNGRRGSDGKMAFIHPILLEAFTKVSEWSSNGSNCYDLYSTFRSMNEDRGYYN